MAAAEIRAVGLSASNVVPPASSSAATSVDKSKQWLQWAGYFCGAMSFVIVPILFTLGAVTFGIINIRRGEDKHGWQQIGLGVVGLLFSMLLYVSRRWN